MPPARGQGVPIPAKWCPPIIRRGANPSCMRIPEVKPVVIAATGAPAEGNRVAVIARRRDPYAAEPGVKCRIAPGDPGCRAHAERSHGSSALSTRVVSCKSARDTGFKVPPIRIIGQQFCCALARPCAYHAAPLKPSGAGERRLGSVKLTMPPCCIALDSVSTSVLPFLEVGYVRECPCLLPRFASVRADPRMCAINASRPATEK